MKTKSIALGGVLLALCMVLLYGAVVVPTMQLSLYSAASFLVAVMIIEGGTRSGWLLYAASSILGFVLVPDKLSLMIYVLCYGLYGLVKHYVERLHRRPLEIVLKLLFLNGSFALLFLLFREAFLGDAKILSQPVYVIFFFMQGLFILYDIAFSMLVSLYLRRKR